MNRQLVVTLTPGTVVSQDATSVTVSGDFTFGVSDVDSYVQVRFLWYEGSRELLTSVKTFRDPSKQLIVGSFVKVPAADFPNGWAIGQVTALGRGADLLDLNDPGTDVISAVVEQVFAPPTPVTTTDPTPHTPPTGITTTPSADTGSPTGPPRFRG